MMSIQEQAVQMINCLSEDNIIFLQDFMKRFMLPENKQEELIKERKSSADFMKELEDMRIRTKTYFPKNFDVRELWEEAVDKKYGNFS